MAAASLPLPATGWQAPEVLQGQSTTTAADVFSFGVVLYELSE